MPFQIILITFCLLAGHVLPQAIVVAQSDSITAGPKEDNPVDPADIEAAETKLKTAKQRYQKMLTLAKKSSVAKADVNDARLQWQMAELQLKSLRAPESAAGYRVRQAELKLEFQKDKTAVAKRLFNAGSLSELRYRRQAYELKFAEIDLKAATGDVSAESAKLLSSRKRFELAKIELELAKKLYSRRSITQTTYQRMVDRVRETKTEMNKLEESQKKKQAVIKDKTRT